MGAFWSKPGLVEAITGWATTDLYTEITMTNFGQNPVQATKTNKQFPQFLWDPTLYSSGRDDVNIRV